MLVTMNDILLPAKREGYGVGFFNAINVEMARAVIGAAQELNAPVIVGTAEVDLLTAILRRRCRKVSVRLISLLMWIKPGRWELKPELQRERVAC